MIAQGSPLSRIRRTEDGDRRNLQGCGQVRQTGIMPHEQPGLGQDSGYSPQTLTPNHRNGLEAESSDAFDSLLIGWTSNENRLGSVLLKISYDLRHDFGSNTLMATAAARMAHHERLISRKPDPAKKFDARLFECVRYDDMNRSRMVPSLSSQHV